MATTYTEYAKFNYVAGVSGSENKEPRIFASGSSESTPKLYISQSTGIVDLAGGNTLSIAADTGSNDVDLTDDTFTISGTSNEIETEVDGMSVVVGLPNDVTIGNDLTVTGDMSANGGVTLGNASSDVATVTAQLTASQGATFSEAVYGTTLSGSGTIQAGGSIKLAQKLLPSVDDSSDLGSSSKEFKDLYLDGVAYIDELQADQLGAALDCNSQAMTNVNVDSGNIDGTTIGANSQAAGEFTTVSGSGAFQGGSTATFAGSVTAGSSFVIGSADLNETDMEKLDGITDGTVAANKAVVVDSNADISGFRNVTATGYFEIGSAQLTESEMEMLDGITAGTVAADKAVVVDSNLDFSGYRDMSGSGDISVAGVSKFGNKLLPHADDDIDLGASTKEFKDLYLDGVAYIDELQADQLGAALDANSQAITNINVDSGNIDGTTIGANSQAAGEFTTVSGSGAFQGGSTATFAGSVTAGSSFVIGSADLNETDMEKLDGITNGTAAASKAVVLDASKDISGLNDVSAATYTATGAITAGSSFIIGSADLNETDMEKLDGITDGTAAANKALVLDASSDVSGINALGIASMASNWTNASRTVADMGTVTTMDLNGGTIDGTTIGAASQASGSFTALSGSGKLSVAGISEFAKVLRPLSDDAVDLGSSSKEFKDLYLDGVAYIDELQADQLGADLDANSQDITSVRTLTLNNSFFPTSNGAVALGRWGGAFSDLYLADGGVAIFGDDQDVTLTHVADTGLLLNSSMQLQFRDSDLKVASSADGQLDVDADAEVEVEAPIIDLNASTSVRVSTKMCIGDDAASFGSNELLVLPSTGKIKAAAYVTYSDEALKTNIETIDSALETVKSLRGVSYDVKATGNQELGLIAQEVNEIIPSVVQSESDVMGIDYSRLTAVLIEAVKELAAKVETNKK